MAKATPQNEKLVGVVPLETNESQYALERLGPPPGNAELLIRGGAGWVFGIAPREESLDPRITELGKAPHPDEVALALAREMAWRWFHGHEPFRAQGSAQRKTDAKKGVFPRRYMDAEKGFVAQMLGLPRGVSFISSTSGVSYSGEIMKEFSPTCKCAQEGTKCVSPPGQKCAEE
jgi:hypothetical protein